MISAKIFNCDCLTGLQNIPDNSIDCVITDPPYNLGNISKRRGYHVNSIRENNFVSADWDNSSGEVWRDLMQNVFKFFSRKVKVGGNIVVFCCSFKIGELFTLAEQFGLYYKTTGVWHKTNPMPRNKDLHFVCSNEFWIHFVNQKRTGTFNNNGKLLLDFFASSLPSTKERGGFKHPTQKPLALITPLVEILSNKGDTILDCFAGSGSTAVAAINTSRNFIGFEINKNYFDFTKLKIERLLENMKIDDVIVNVDHTIVTEDVLKKFVVDAKNKFPAGKLTKIIVTADKDGGFDVDFSVKNLPMLSQEKL